MVKSSDFFQLLEKVERAAFHYGSDSRPLREHSKQPFRDAKHQREFIRACHQGFEKAQRTVIQMIGQNRVDTTINEAERKRRELILRKVIDGILFTMVAGQTWVTRRVVLHDSPPAIDLKTIAVAQREADRLNAEDRMSFAVLADLSTFVHVCDIVRGFPLEKHKLHFLELKEGRVNELLEEKLTGYEPVPESLQKLSTDAAIEDRYKPQAKRILKQRIRLNQTIQVLQTDEGVDIKSGLPFRTNHDVIPEESYRKVFVAECERAIREKVSAFRVNYCLHFGIAFGGSPEANRRLAVRAATWGLLECIRTSEGVLQARYKEIGETVGKEAAPFHVLDLIANHLQAVPANSLFTWNLPYPVLWAIIRNEMSICCAFDLAGFMHAVEVAGLQPRLSSRKESEAAFAHVGRNGAPSFAGRVVKIAHPDHPGDRFLLSGAYGRFINNLHSPINFLEGMRQHWTALPAEEESSSD